MDIIQSSVRSHPHECIERRWCQRRMKHAHSTSCCHSNRLEFSRAPCLFSAAALGFVHLPATCRLLIPQCLHPARRALRRRTRVLRASQDVWKAILTESGRMGGHIDELRGTLSEPALAFLKATLARDPSRRASATALLQMPVRHRHPAARWRAAVDEAGTAGAVRNVSLAYLLQLERPTMPCDGERAHGRATRKNAPGRCTRRCRSTRSCA